MAGIDDINVNFDSDDKKINIDDNILSGDTNIDVKNDDALYGVDLLANKNYSSGNSDNGGYSSGEESTKKKDEDYDFFKEKEEKTPEIPTFKEEEKKSIPIDDPLLNESKAYENGGFKPLGAMNVQEIKNEKIDLIYKFKKLEGQGIRTTMNYNMS